jgi:hypothetical protein
LQRAFIVQTILKRLKQLGEDELLMISEAIDVEMERRQERIEEIPDSARRRAVMRGQSYRRATGSTALPIRITGLKEQRKRPFAA